MQIIKKMLNKKIKEVLAMLPVMNRNREFMPGLLEDFFKTDLWPDLTNKNRANTPAVNVSETDKEYKIDVAAPGLNKNDFKIDLEDNILTISSEKEEKNEEQDKENNYLKREFCYTAFSRSFVLPDNVNADKIEASHKDGVLNVRIPKKEVKKETKSIKVS